jgi:hypothetical protein
MNINDVIQWTEKVIEQKFSKEDPYLQMKNGCILCELVGKIQGKYLVYNRNPRNARIMERENIEIFITELEKMEVSKPKWDYNDLVSKSKKEKEILSTLYELGTKALKNKNLPKLKVLSK